MLRRITLLLYLLSDPICWLLFIYFAYAGATTKQWVYVFPLLICGFTPYLLGKLGTKLEKADQSQQNSSDQTLAEKQQPRNSKKSSVSPAERPYLEGLATLAPTFQPGTVDIITGFPHDPVHPESLNPHLNKSQEEEEISFAQHQKQPDHKQRLIEKNMNNIKQPIQDLTKMKAGFEYLRGILNPSDEEMKQLFHLSEEEFKILDKGTYKHPQKEDLGKGKE